MFFTTEFIDVGSKLSITWYMPMQSS